MPEELRELLPDGFLTDLITATSDDGEPSLSDDEVFAAVLLSILAGGDTTVDLIAQLVTRMLDGDRELWRQAEADRSLLDGLIDEVVDPRRPDATRHLRFGRGACSCTGSALARAETRHAIEALLDGLPTARLVPGHEVRRMFSTAIQSVLDGLVVAWDVPEPT
ncbi:hypothetical protein [Geodermatophilus sp. URMC 62]|uniref:hypothetical protein n=1 Tax=Geodermatophilus sp. URMC 62 TaxID=3423414 RepID=UPI00406BF48B